MEIQKIDQLFKDYYKILNIELKATKEDIKTAFKTQALYWHPDRNRSHNATQMMQDINEAKLILLDKSLRDIYDIEYQKYILHLQKQSKIRSTSEDNSNTDTYTSRNDNLNERMDKARKQAVNLAKETIEDIRNMTKSGLQASVKYIDDKIPSLLISAVIMLIVAILFTNC